MGLKIVSFQCFLEFSETKIPVVVLGIVHVDLSTVFLIVQAGKPSAPL
jgi:hypothetical protein